MDCILLIGCILLCLIILIIGNNMKNTNPNEKKQLIKENEQLKKINLNLKEYIKKLKQLNEIYKQK